MNNEHQSVIEDDEGKTFLFSYTKNCIYNDNTRFVVSWWVRNAYFNNEQLKISDVVLMNAEFSSSGSFGSILGQNVFVITHI